MSWFGSQNLDRGICVSVFGSQELDIWVWVSEF